MADGKLCSSAKDRLFIHGNKALDVPLCEVERHVLSAALIHRNRIGDLRNCSPRHLQVTVPTNLIPMLVIRDFVNELTTALALVGDRFHA